MTAGFIIGFDSETESAAEAIDRVDRGSGDPGLHGGSAVCIAAHATRAPARKGRPSVPHPERKDLKTADQCTMGLNFKTLRPRQEVVADYAYILERIYDPVAYAGRLQRLAGMLDNSGWKQQTRAAHSRRKLLAFSKCCIGS